MSLQTNWKSTTSNDNRKYYYNTITNKSQWEPPYAKYKNQSSIFDFTSHVTPQILSITLDGLDSIKDWNFNEITFNPTDITFKSTNDELLEIYGVRTIIKEFFKIAKTTLITLVPMKLVIFKYVNGNHSTGIHRHNSRSITLFIGDDRIFTINNIKYMIRNGEYVILDKQRHGVPKMPEAGTGYSFNFLYCDTYELPSVSIN